MRPIIAMSRNIHKAGNEHSCFAGCGDTIPKGESYINDKLTKNEGQSFRPIVRTIMNLAWHMKCAPLTNEAAKKILEDALKENAKLNPTQLGVDSNA